MVMVDPAPTKKNYQINTILNSNWHPMIVNWNKSCKDIVQSYSSCCRRGISGSYSTIRWTDDFELRSVWRLSRMVIARSNDLLVHNANSIRTNHDWLRQSSIWTSLASWSWTTSRRSWSAISRSWPNPVDDSCPDKIALQCRFIFKTVFSAQFLCLLSFKLTWLRLYLERFSQHLTSI